MTCSQTEPPLHRIPQELMERIVELANPRDLLAFRAVGTGIKDKVSYCFIKSHIRSRTCFVLDRACLHTLAEIASDPTLVRELRSLTISLAPLHPSTPASIHLAAGDGKFAHPIAQDKAAALLVLESQHLHPGPIDRRTLARLLQKLNTFGACQLSMVLTSPMIYGTSEALSPFSSLNGQATSGPTRGTVPFAPRYDTAYHDLLQAVAMGAKFDVSSIEIDDRQFVRMELLGCAGVKALQRSMRALKSVHIIVGSVILDHHDQHAHINTLRDIRYSQTQRLILLAAEDLQALKVVGDTQMAHFCCDKSFQPDVLNVSTMLMIRPLCRLTELTLEHISVPETVMFCMLGNCGPTLRSISISDVIIDATSWRGVFIQLRRTCPLLECIKFQGLVTRHSGGEYVPTVFDIKLRQKHLHAPPIDPYFDDGVLTHWKEHNMLEVRGRASVQERLATLSSADEYRESDFCTSIVTVETFGEWQRKGRGSADCFGLDDLMERCTRAH